MIAKKVTRSSDKNSYKGLASYILDIKKKGQKVSDSWLVNCLAPNSSLAVKEIEATQSLNSRTTQDKTYHLVISFRAGEKVEADVMKKVEKLICERLGYHDHQRLVVVHDDTDNLHMHVAINKIHPNKFTIHEPKADYKKISDACIECELKFGLEKDNHIPLERQGATISAKARDKEVHSGEESFQRWLTENLKSELEKALSRTDCSWQKVHVITAKYDVVFRRRANGLVLSHRRRKLFVKGSSVSRTFGMGRLEKQLGEFSQPSTQINIKAKLSYEPNRKRDNSPLYHKFLKEKQKLQDERQSSLARLREEQQNRYEAIQKEYQKRRFDVKFNNLIRRKKTILIELSKTRNQDIQNLREEFAEKRAECRKNYTVVSWNEFRGENRKRSNQVEI